MKVDRGIVTLGKMADNKDFFVKAAPAERVGFIWELTAELWSLTDNNSVERRLQRDVTNLIRQRG